MGFLTDFVDNFFNAFKDGLANKYRKELDPNAPTIVTPPKGVNAMKIVVNTMVLLALFLLFYGVQDDVHRWYGTYFWNHGMKSDMKLAVIFIGFIIALLIMGFGLLLNWVSILYMCYITLFFMYYMHSLLITIPLCLLLLNLILLKLQQRKQR
jgi:hypothetical protein